MFLEINIRGRTENDYYLMMKHAGILGRLNVLTSNFIPIIIEENDTRSKFRKQKTNSLRIC